MHSPGQGEDKLAPTLITYIIISTSHHSLYYEYGYAGWS